MGGEFEELCNANTNDDGDEVAEDGVAGLGQWRFDGVVFEYACCTLILFRRVDLDEAEYLRRRR